MTQEFRIFRGSETKQVDLNGKPAQPDAYYFEPSDYEGDTLWSTAFPSEVAASVAASAEPEEA